MKVSFLIPRSTIAVHCHQKTNGRWSAKMVNTENFYEKVIDKDLTGDQMAAVSALLISAGSQQSFFGKDRKEFSDIRKELKKQFKLIKSKYA